ncbi:MAG: hypothetical protein IJT58_00985 [Synergistaceae bacterium]|nr:hypothetical protein [Synergistaceae bacterium]
MLKKVLPVITALIVLLNAQQSDSATYNVTTSLSEGQGSLSWAVNSINSLGGDGHIIEFDEGVRLITLEKELTINAGVIIEGNGVCINGSGNSRLFTVTSGKVFFNEITFTKGCAVENNGGAVNIEGSNASAEFTNCTFYSNTADNFGGAVCITNGSEKDFTVFTHCTITGNDAAYGGGIAVIKGDSKVFASIITGNTDDEIYTGEKATLAGTSNILGNYDVSIGTDNLTGQAVNEVLMTDSKGLAKLESVDKVQVIKLTPTSPARDYVSSENRRSDIDEVGTLRPQLNGYDAGAFEALPVPVQSVKISGTPYMQINTSYTFSADISPVDASINFEDYPPNGIVWKSNNPEILAIDSAGKATALNIGEAYITAEVHGWDSKGQDSVQTSSEALSVLVGTEALGAMQASIYGLDERVELSKGKYKILEPVITVDINGIEVENPKFSLTAASSRPSIVTAEIISGDMVRLSASEKTGSADIRVTVKPLPSGNGTYKDFVVSVAEIQQDNNLARSSGSSSGGCNSGFRGIMFTFTGALVVLLVIIKTGKKERGNEN